MDGSGTCRREGNIGASAASSNPSRRFRRRDLPSACPPRAPARETSLHGSSQEESCPPRLPGSGSITTESSNVGSARLLLGQVLASHAEDLVEGIPLVHHAQTRSGSGPPGIRAAQHYSRTWLQEGPVPVRHRGAIKRIASFGPDPGPAACLTGSRSPGSDHAGSAIGLSTELEGQA